MTTPSLTNPNPKREGIDHEFKSHPDVFWPAAHGEKTFEFRKDDRGGYQVGQTVRLRCFADGSYTADAPLDRVITNILRPGEFGLQDGYCILSLASARPSPGDPVRAALEGKIAEARRYADRNDFELSTLCPTREETDVLLAALSVSTPTGEGEACDWVKLPSEADLAEIIDDCLAVNNPGDGGSWAGAAGAIASSLHSRSERKPSALGDNHDAEITRVMAMSDDEVLAEGGDPEQASLFVNAAFDRAKIIAENRRLRNALERARSVLGNMALEHETGWRSIFARWPIHHEPLRSDARHLLPVIDAALFGVAPSQKPEPYVADERGTPITGLSWCAAQPHEKSTSHCPACGVGPLEACRGRVPQDDQASNLPGEA